MTLENHQRKREFSCKVIEQIVDGNKFPTLPSIAMEAIRLMEGEHSSFDSIGNLLKNDQVLAGRILQYANSSFIGARRQVTTINQAVSLAGFNAVRSIILSVSIFDCFSGKLKIHKKNLVNFWLHSIGVAATAEILAGKLGFSAPDEAYAAGLVHDLGKLICYLDFPEKFEEVCQELDRQGAQSKKEISPLELESNVLGVNHIETGKMLAEHWQFPEDLVRVMWLHHQPVFESILPDSANLPKLVRFADVLCVTHNVGSSYFLTSQTHSFEHFNFALEKLALHHHLAPTDIDAIMKEVHGRVQEVASVLGIWDEKSYYKLVSSANASLGKISLDLEREKRELVETNRVLSAISEIGRYLKPGGTVVEAAQRVVDAAMRAFGTIRCLCMIRDEAKHVFMGKFFDGNAYHEVRVPAQPNALRNYSQSKTISDIEAEASHRLARTSLDISQGRFLESGIIDMVAGSRFLASFFIADRQLHGGPGPVLGELIVDFSCVEGFHGNRQGTITEKFETFAVAAATAVQRMLLAESLTRQTNELAENSRKMEESQRQLFHSHRLATVGRLAAGAAHEINNPLTIISLNVQILNRLLNKNKENHEIMERLQILQDQEERISKIIQDLMGFARPAQPQFSQSSVSEVIAKVLSVIVDRVAMTKIQVKNCIPTDLPPVMVDPLQIEQVFMNLLINAVQAMPDGGIITLSAALTEGGSVEIKVADTGSGISRKNLAKIFDPFFTTKKEGEGTGLGLAVCHSIVEHNGGSMRVKSEVGKGSVFTVNLPVDKGVRLRAMKQRIEEEKPALKATFQENCRILVIDDERILNDMLQESLRNVGYKTDGAYDGVEGIGKLRYRKYHLVLLDIRMPRKDGLEVLEFIREHYPDVKVVIITGLATNDEIRATVRQGAFACLKKPFQLEKVLETVEKALFSSCYPISK